MSRIIEDLIDDLRFHRYETSYTNGIKSMNMENDVIGILEPVNQIMTKGILFRPRANYIATLWFNNPLRKASLESSWYLETYSELSRHYLTKLISRHASNNDISLKVKQMSLHPRKEVFYSDFDVSLRNLLSDYA